MTSHYGTDFAHVGEGFYLRGPANAWWDVMRPAPLLIYCHGATGTAATVAGDVNETKLLRLLSRRFLVLVSDWGFDTYANDTGIARLVEGIAAARAARNVTADPAVLVGMSMGFGVAAAYTLANPTQVRAIAGMIPLSDLNDVVVNNRGGLASAVHAAYGGAYSNTVHGPTHNPLLLAPDLPVDLPIRLWSSSNDTFVPPSTTDALVTARPQTVRTNMGAKGHSTASIAGSQQAIADWCFAQITA